LFLTDGCVASAVINAAGSWHDGRLDYFLDVDNVLSRLPAHLKVAVDSAFAGSLRKIRGLTESELRGLDARNRSLALTAHAILAKLRVGAEWGIGGTSLVAHFLVFFCFSSVYYFVLLST
jgi:hypothetical protein